MFHYLNDFPTSSVCKWWAVFYNFALLKLKIPATLSEMVGIVCLARNPHERFDGFEFTVSGWGKTSYPNGFSSSKLRKTIVFGITQERCSKMYQNVYKIVPNLHICAEALNKDACQGDSGGISLFT